MRLRREAYTLYVGDEKVYDIEDDLYKPDKFFELLRVLSPAPTPAECRVLLEIGRHYWPAEVLCYIHGVLGVATWQAREAARSEYYRIGVAIHRGTYKDRDEEAADIRRFMREHVPALLETEPYDTI